MEQEHKSGTSRLVSGGAWFLGLMTLSGVFWLILDIQISQAYGRTGLGLFNTASSVFDFAWAFIFGGLFEGLIHFGTAHMTKEDSNIAKFFSKYVRYLTVMSLVIFVVLTVLAFQVTSDVQQIFVLAMAFAFLFSGTKDALSSILGSLHKNRELSSVNAVGFYVITFVGLVFILLNAPYELLPVLITIGPVFQAMLCVYFTRSYLKDLIFYNFEFFANRKIKNALVEDLKCYKHILFFGFSVSVGKISFMVMKSLDIPILGLFFNLSDVGVYSVADTASSVLFSMTAFALPIIATISEAWTKKDWDELEKCVKLSVKLPLILGLPLTIIIFVLAEPIVLGVFGPAFAGAVLPLQILIIGTFLLMFGYTLSSVLIGIGKPKLSGILMGVAALQYMISIVILVPIFGMTGAAISLTLTGVTSLILIPLFIKRNLKFDIFSGLWKVLFASAVLGFLLLLIPTTNFFFVFFGALGCCVVYGLLIYYTKYITKEEIQTLKATPPQQ
jgi:O-antigen/teichoic acid export membrane protein